MLHEKILDLKAELIQYSDLVECMISNGMNGLFKKDNALLEKVINVDEKKANEKEILLDEMSTNIIAQYQPAAKELRTVLMLLKMNNDLERLGDHAVNISQSALALIEKPQIKPYVDLPKMFEIVLSMFKDSIKSLINEDARLALEVCGRDDEVDNLKSKITEELVGLMSKDCSTVERAINILRIISNLERIADLSTNICEDVMYLVEGRVIKHHLEDNPWNRVPPCF